MIKTKNTLKKTYFIFLILTNSFGFGQCWSKIAATENRTLAIQNDGTLWSWGRNNLGSIGDGTNFNRYTPFQISAQTDWMEIYASQNHFSFAIKTSGILWGWGRNNQGQLGNGTLASTNIPVQIGNSTWKQITCGMSCALGIKTDGTLWGWGDNYFGQLGTGNTNSSIVPIQISNENWKSVASRLSSTYAIKQDGTLWSWGDNLYGQLGYGTLNPSYSPVQVGTSNNWKTVVSGGNNTIAITNDGKLWAWGKNSLGSLGDGTTVNRLAPVQIGTDNWESIALGEQESTIGIKTNNTLWGWGYNGYRQMTSTITTSTNIPTQISVLTDWKSTVLGFGHSVNIKLDGTLYTAGYNLFGQLGDDTNVDKDALTNVTCQTLQIKKFSTEDLISFYPNPAKNTINLDTKETILKVEIYDISGRILSSNSVIENKIDISNLKIGNYILKVFTVNGVMSSKIIKE